MKRNFQRIACVFLAVTAVMLPSCKKKDKGFEPSFGVKAFETEDPQPIRFSIPQQWGQIADPSGSGILVFAGEEAYQGGSFNNVSVCIYPSGSEQAPEITDVQASVQEGFETKIKEQYAEASEFVYEMIEAPLFQVFTAAYTVPSGDMQLKQKVYYPLTGNLQIYVAACDNGGEGISADEMAHTIIQTLYLGGNEEEASSEE